MIFFNPGVNDMSAVRCKQAAATSNKSYNTELQDTSRPSDSDAIHDAESLLSAQSLAVKRRSLIGLGRQATQTRAAKRNR